jgi:UDP-N-acetylglucosamine--N-acetylmuramyl-(pentapeptide) pyrophosphoryl-undecaprenol N-acetylglucosamine transferase
MNAGPQTVMIMAGGTGGHIYPGLAVAGALRHQGIGVHWLGAQGGMECTVVPAQDIPLDLVRISGVRGKGLLGWLALPFRLLRAVRDARASMLKVAHAAGPGGIAAWLRGVPLIVHEQNRIPGLTNKVLARLARRVLQAFPGTFPERAGALTCGNPVRANIAALPAPEVRFFQRYGRPRLLVTGGSQGAGSLNRTVPAALALLPGDLRPRVCHQAGKGNTAATQQRYAEAGIEAQVQDFIENMAEAYAWADLVICRSGALTVSELAAAGVGAVLVPFPHAVDDHQAANAEYLAAPGAALVIREAQFTPEALAGELAGLLGARARMLEMAQTARGLGVRDAAEQVVTACVPWLRP